MKLLAHKYIFKQKDCQF